MARVDWHGGEVRKEIESHLRSNLDEAGDYLLNSVKAAAPRATGQYRDSLTQSKVIQSKSGLRILVGTKMKHLVYWLEFGTKNLRARPHWIPTLEGSKMKLVRILTRRR